MKSLRFRFNLAFIVIVLINLGGAGVVLHTLWDQKNDAQVINKAGAQRMLSQKLAKESLLLAAGQLEAKQLQATASSFHAVLEGLLTGNKDLNLPRTESKETRTQLEKIRRLWEATSAATSALITARQQKDAALTASSLQTIIDNNPALLDEMNSAVGMFERTSNAKVSRLWYLQSGVVLAVVLCVLWLWLGSVRHLITRLERLIQDAAENSETLSRISAQISSASNDLSEGSNSQASSLEETSAALEEMASMTRQNADNTMKANELATKMQNEAEVGDDSMRKMGHAVNEITDSSSEIGKIIKVIEEIAFQTNLLALNAAVEAARAGDAGKGFAVVADEVRNLAQRSSTAAQETNALIDRAVQRAKNGSTIAEKTGKQLALICGMIKEVNSIVEGITTANNEQAQGVDQVNTAVSNMDRITQSNAALAEETSSAAEELTGQAQRLNDMVISLRALVHGGGSGHSPTADNSGGGFFRRKPPASSRKLIAPAGAPSIGQGEFVPWSPQMSTGIDSMDDQHKVLFRLINELHRSLKNGSDKTIMGRILQELTDYTDTHFSKEEEMLRSIGYPQLHQQEKLHREFVAKLNELIDNQKSGKMMIGLDALQFLKKWLTIHIQKVDHEYGPFVHDRGIN